MSLSTSDFANVQQGKIAHLATTATVTTADATSDSTCLSLIGALRTSMTNHAADGTTAHTKADTTSALLQNGSMAAQLNSLVGFLEDHAQLAGPHVSPDRTNSHLATTYAVPTESFCWRRANELKAAWNAHLTSALSSS